MITVILAGGLGKRMKLGNFPKVCVKVRGIPMIVRTVNSAILLKSEMIIVVVSPGTHAKIKSTIDSYVKNRNIFYAIQEKSLGTGDALKACIPYLEELDPFEKVLILNGDMPLLSFYTLNTFVKWKLNKTKILSCKIDNPSGYGRVLRDNKLNFQSITEDKDCTEEERKTKHVNAGIYYLVNLEIQQNIGNVKNNNAQKEYYITDLINMVNPEVYMLESKFQKELLNVNDQETLKSING